MLQASLLVCLFVGLFVCLVCVAGFPACLFVCLFVGLFVCLVCVDQCTCAQSEDFCQHSPKNKCVDST